MKGFFKMIKMTKEYSKCLFALLLSALIITLSLCLLAHSSREASSTSFSASQIYEMTGADEEEGEIASKVGEEIVNVFGS